MKKSVLVLALASVFSTGATAGGILLHEVATFDSVSSAGVANTTNRKDASAAITSPAGLTAIEDSSFSIGLQYLDAYSEHNGTGALGNKSNNYGENKAVAPSLAYAKRVNDQWVLGASLHADGGLGMDYTNGRSGIGAVDKESQEAVNIHLAAGYQATDELSLGGALVVQHLMTTLDGGFGPLNVEGEDNNTAASFILSAMYDLSDTTYVSANYKHRVKHDTNIKLDSNVGSATADMKVNWPGRIDLGIQHQINDQLTLKAMTGIEFWSDFDDAAKDVYSVGTAVEYTHQSWTYQAGIRYDSKMYDTKDMAPELAIGENWSIGLGAEKTRSNGHRIGLSYEYRDLGTHNVTYTIGETDIPYFDGRVDENRIHVLALSYAY